MANLPPIKRFSTEDFQEQASWIGKLFAPLNLLLTTIYSALNNGITLGQNVNSQVKMVPVTGSSPSVSFLYSFSPNVPIGISIINVVQTSSPTIALTSAVGCTWSISGGSITATVQGLGTNSTYNVTFVVWGG